MDRIIAPDVIFLTDVDNPAIFRFRVRPRKTHLNRIDELFQHQMMGYRMYKDLCDAKGRMVTPKEVWAYYELLRKPLYDDKGANLCPYIWQGVRLFEYVKIHRNSNLDSIRVRSLLLPPAEFCFEELINAPKAYIAWNLFKGTNSYKMRVTTESHSYIYDFRKFVHFNKPVRVAQVKLRITPNDLYQYRNDVPECYYDFCIHMERNKKKAPTKRRKRRRR